MNPKEAQKRRRERIVIFILIPLLLFLIYLEGHCFNFNIGLPNSLLFFVLLNVNIILLLLLVFLVFRNLVKLIVERRKGIIGSKIRTKLVVLFISLALLPTLVLFGTSVKFALSTFNYWFNMKVGNSLTQALQVGKSYYQQISNKLNLTAEKISLILTSNSPFTHEGKNYLKKYLINANIDFFQLYAIDGKLWLSFRKKNISLKNINQNFRDIIKEVLAKRQPINLIKSLPEGDLVITVFPIFKDNQLKEVFLAGKLIPASLVKSFEGIRQSVEDYKQLMLFIRPLKFSIFLIFSIITLLVLFAATWIGFHLAKGLTAPIQTLAAATQEVANGNLDIQLEANTEDELGMLINSFNKMIRDLKTAYQALNQQKEEIAKRHKYIEILLKNIKTGVISTDAQGIITTINPAALNILGEQLKTCLGQPLSCLGRISPELKEIFIQLTQQEYHEKQLRINLGRKRLSLLIGNAALKDDNNRLLGHVFVFEDITELEKMQRMAAWREVARRIAHEIKNPLTPIQLSAQRLRRRYLDKIPQKEVFDECTQMIIKQVEGLKQMVNEFSQFARLPAINPAPNDLFEVVNEALAIYRNAHSHIQFSLTVLQYPPVFLFDKEQIKRALINLLDNAISSIENQGQIEVILDYDRSLKIARLEIKDTGKGIPDEIKPYLFEPYFSTKKSGTGLGLTIVHRIVADHQGFIRVKDNQPQGTTFIIELPVKT